MELTQDAQPAASSPAPVPESPADHAVVAGDQAAFKAAKQAVRSGKPLTKPAESSPAQPGQAASTDASPEPASEPGSTPKNQGVKARMAELDPEIAQLQEKLRLRAALREELERTSTPHKAESSPAAAAVLNDGKPKLSAFIEQIGTTFTSYEEANEAYIDARDAWRDWQTARAQSDTQRRQQIETQGKAYLERLQAYRKDHPDFDAATAEFQGVLSTWLPWSAVDQTTTVRTPSHDIAEVIFTGEHPAQWQLYFVTHPDAVDRLSALPGPEAVYREMGRIEASFSAPVTPQPVYRTVPEPPTTLGRRPADPTDEVEAAVASGDMHRFKAMKQQQRLSQVR